MKRALAAAAAALSYFTILPIRAPSAPDGFALSFLPLIGALVGALSGAVGYVAWLLSHSTLWAALAAWIASIVLTGAIHIDGFLDCCDGVLASTGVERRLEILRDPTHGTYAVVGMAMLSAVWIAALAAIAPPLMPLALAFAEGLARLAALLNAWLQPYARPSVTAAFSNRPNAGIALLGVGVVLAIGYAVKPDALYTVIAAPIVALALGMWIARRLGGGLTGDCYGAIVCVTLVVALPLIAAALQFPGR